MAVKVRATIGKEKYYTEVIAGEHKIITDEPKNLGGKNKGFNPFEILATSLASCTAATLRMYIDKKGWDIGTIDVNVTLERFPKTGLTVLSRELAFECVDLDVEAREKLYEIAEKCPVHHMLTETIEIKTIIL